MDHLVSSLLRFDFREKKLGEKMGKDRKKKGRGGKIQKKNWKFDRKKLLSVYDSPVILSSQIDMDLQTAKDALCTARIAWHDTLGKDVKNEYEAIEKLDRAIEALQVWLPSYDPKATDTYGADP